MQSTSRIISADRMEAKSPMQDEDEEDSIPSSSIGDPVQSTSRIISADRMEAKSPMQQDEDEDDPIPSSPIGDPVQLTSRESPMPTEGAGGPAEALEGSTKGRRRKGAGDDDESLPSSQSSGFGDAKPKKKRDTTPLRLYQQITDEDEFNASEVAATLK